MGHLGTKPEIKAPNAGRATNYTRDRGVPATLQAWPVAAKTARSLPPPPPPMAATRPRSGFAPKRQVSEPLPLLPQWAPEASANPLQPAADRGAGFWWRVAGVSFGAGFLISAGYLGALAQLEHTTPRFVEMGAPRAEQTTVHAVSLPLMASTNNAAHVLTNAVLAAAPPAAEPALLPHDAKPAPIAGAKRTRAVHPRLATQAAATDDSEASASEDEADTEAPVTRDSAARENLPAQPSRGDVQKGMEQLRAQLTTCAAGEHGTTYANLTIAGNGHVSYSVMEGGFSGTPAGSCMARTLRAGSFPRFSGPSFKVRYPFVF